MKKLTLMVLGFLAMNGLFAQCGSGEVSLSMSIATDNWGYECYWEIVPLGNACGDGTIASGGNPDVGCTGGGAQSVNSGGYPNNDVVNEGDWCLEIGVEYTLIYVDDWGDGGANFTLNFNDFPMLEFMGSGDGNTWNFVAMEPASLDLSVEHVKLYSYTWFGTTEIEGDIKNNGTEIVSSLTLSYSINGGDWVVDELSGLYIPPLTTYDFVHSTPWSTWNSGDYEIEIKVETPNGGTDEVPENNSVVENTERGPGIPNIIDQYITVTPVLNVISTPADQLDGPRDLDFHPHLTRKELWVLNKENESEGSSTTIYFDAGEDGQSDIWRRDGNAWHFMSLATGIAFSENENFGTSPGVYDANHDGGSPFTGPSLWTSDLSIYAQPSGGNGSHLDMLHVSPNSQGIASESDNVFWVVDGFNNDIVRYDFVEDHGAGNSFHGDARILRWSDFEIAKDPNDHIVSHCVLQKQTGILYVVDHGNQRVMAVDINTGNLASVPSFGPFEDVSQYNYVTGYDFDEIVSEGLVEPAGIDVVGNRLIVSDHSNGDIVIYDLSSNPVTELHRIETGQPGIMGVKIGPQGRIWYVNTTNDEVVRIDGVTVGLDNLAFENELLVYPNPVSGTLFVDLPFDAQSYSIRIFDASGRQVVNQIIPQGKTSFSTSELGLSAGMYQLQIGNGEKWYSNKLIVQ